MSRVPRNRRRPMSLLVPQSRPFHHDHETFHKISDASPTLILCSTRRRWNWRREWWRCRARTATSRTLTVSFENLLKVEEDFKAFPISVTTQLCSSLINQLMLTTNNVMQLHQRLRTNDEPTSTGNNNLMLKELENAVIMTQSMLTKITTR